MSLSRSRLAMMLVLGFSALGVGFVSPPVASAGTTLHSVSATTLCKSFAVRDPENDIIRCKSGHATSNKKRAKYQAEIVFATVGSGSAVLFRADKKSSCKSMNLTFWSSQKEDKLRDLYSIKAADGTRSATEHGDKQVTVTSRINRGPFRVSAKEIGYTGGLVYIAGSARCFTKDGRV